VDTKTNSSQTGLLSSIRTWHVLTLLLGVFIVGLGLVMIDDPGDARREIGGALVVGVVVGASILMVEESREARLIKREERMHSDSLSAAWLREVDRDLAAVVFGELGALFSVMHVDETGDQAIRADQVATVGSLAQRVVALAEAATNRRRVMREAGRLADGVDCDLWDLPTNASICQLIVNLREALAADLRRTYGLPKQ